MENSTEGPQKTKMDLSYDPAIPLLGIYPEKTIIPKDTCTPVFMEYGKRIFKKVEICIIDSLG